jgi:DNA-binding CsgD family transcriptional regulator/tetratricopeptide (TPR) repeat protein
VRPLPPETRTLLLVASVEGTGELAAVLAAGRVLGVGPAALEPAERAGLVRVGGLELRFRHPLVRSAIYQGATFLERQAAHRALAGELAGGPRADRRAWHLAAATPEPDEEVAGALEASADRARRRGGPAAAAAALERAAALTPEGGPRTRRMVAAADALWEAGQGIGALALLDRLHPPPADPATRAGIAHIRGAVELGAGTPATACTVLLEGARLVLDSDPGRAAELLTLASWAALAANQADRVLDEIGPAAAGLPDHDPRQRRVGLLVDSLNAAGFGRDGDAAAGVAAGPPAAGSWPHPAFTWMWPMLMVAAAGGTELGPDQQYVRSVAARRAAHTVTSLIIDLANLALAEAARGRWPDAAAAAAEGLRLATDNDQPATAGYFLAMLATIAAEQGRADDCRRLAAEALGVAASFRLAVVAALASWALAILDLTTGAPAAALERLMALHAPGHPSAHAPITLLATGTLVEAASRAGARTGMEPFVARLERWAARDRRAWTQVVARRCRALVSQGEEAERHFRAALATDGLAERPFELARTELLYGEWLRGARRRADARTHLRAALELFERMKVIPWAERARGELRASGETARRRDRGAGSRLTPRELEIACLAAQGLTNRQIADRLYLSAHTVGYHLHKVYAKLGITSRADLRGLGLDD